MIGIHANKRIIYIIASITLFFLLHRFTVGLSLVNTISSSIIYPFLRLQHFIVTPIASLREKSASMQTLRDEVSVLNKRTEQLLAENISLKGLASYAMQTKNLMEFRKRYEDCGIIAQVLARHFSDDNHFFLVDAGARQGIKKDMIALYCNNLIGKVVEVYPWYCKVCAITDRDCKIGAIVLSHAMMIEQCMEGVKGIHEGTNTHHTTLRYVSHLTTVKVGDQVFSSGEGLLFPQGFLLGSVIKAEKGDLFYTIIVEPQIDLHKLEYCMLIARDDI